MATRQSAPPLPRATDYDRAIDPDQPQLAFDRGSGALTATEAFRDSNNIANSGAAEAPLTQRQDRQKATQIGEDKISFRLLDDKRWSTTKQKHERLAKLHRRQTVREEQVGASRSTELEHSREAQIIEGFGGQLGLPDSVVHHAKTLVADIDNRSTIGGPAERAIETVALTALAVSHRELFDKTEWLYRHWTPTRDPSRHENGKLISETDAFATMVEAVDETLNASVDHDTIRSVYEKVFADDHPSPFREDL